MLTVEGVSFAYPGGNPVLNDIRFSAVAGDVLAIVGRNGAGKSTLLRLLNGLRTPKSGTIVVDGQSTADTPVHILAHHIGTVFQAPEQQIFNATVEEEIAFGPRQLGLAGAALEERVRTVMERAELTHAAKSHPLDLDQAARRMVALSSVLAMRPPVLLLDEAQRGLDSRAAALLARIVWEESEAGHCVILVCHDMDFVARCASRVLALATGTIVADRSTVDFFSDDEATRSAGVEIPDPLLLSRALGLPPSLTGRLLAKSFTDALEPRTAKLSSTIPSP